MGGRTRIGKRREEKGGHIKQQVPRVPELTPRHIHPEFIRWTQCSSFMFIRAPRKKGKGHCIIPNIDGGSGSSYIQVSRVVAPPSHVGSANCDVCAQQKLWVSSRSDPPTFWISWEITSTFNKFPFCLELPESVSIA